MLSHSRRLGYIAGALAVIVLLLVVVPRGSSAQAVPTLELGSATHSIDGTIAVPVTATGGALESLSVTVDGAPVPFEVVTADAEAGATVMIAVETSVSMTPFQLAELKTQISALVDTLSASDQVGLVTFGGGATVVQPLTTDRAAFDASLLSITADGGSALYSGVTTAAESLQATNGPALLVLATFGWDWGGVSTHNRAQSIDAVAASGASVYVQSLVFDNGVDVAYLAPLATDGLVHDNFQVASLPASTALLGSAAPSSVLTATVGTLARGSHELVVSSELGVERSAAVEVTNEGLLSTTATAGTDAADPVSVQITSASGLAGVDITATLAGVVLDVAPNGTVTVDPWLFDAGTRPLEVTATVGGALADSLTAPIEVPTLAPILTVDQSSETTVTASVLAQSDTVATLVAVVDGAIVAESTNGTLEVERPSSGALTFEARSDAGAVVIEETVSATAVVEPVTPVTDGGTGTNASSAGSSIWTSPTFVAIPVAVIGIVLLLGVRRRRQPTGTRAERMRAAMPEPVELEDADPTQDLVSDLEPVAPVAELAEMVDQSVEPVEEPTVLAEMPSEDSEPAEIIEFAPRPVEPAPEPEIPVADVFPTAAPVEDPKPTPIHASDWAVVVRAPSGETRKVDVGFEPVSIGASKLCTVTLDGEAVRFVHLVIARDGYEIKAHQFGPVTVNGKERNVEGDETLTNSVMEIGDVSIWLERAVQENAVVDAA